MKSEIEWSFVSDLDDLECVDKFEQENCVKIPSDLKETIKKYNAGQPSKNIFDTDKSTGNVFGALLSFNDSDIDNIYVYYPIFKSENESLIPFATDPFGNFLCLLNGNIVLWDHEISSTEFVASSFSDLLNKLYDDEDTNVK
jgi:hypothetical protein